MNIGDVIMCDGNICRDDKLLKDTNCFFISFHPINVICTNKYGGDISEIFHDDDTVGTIKSKLFEKKFLRDGGEYLMEGNNILNDGMGLFGLNEFDPLRIFVGFVINVTYSDKFMYRYLVNVDTKISRLKVLLSDNRDVAQNMVSLCRGTTKLDDGQTIKYYLITGATESSSKMSKKKKKKI